MKDEKGTKGGCCSCEADFQKEIHHLVDGVEGYTKKEHDKKKKELDETFSKDNKEKK